MLEGATDVEGVIQFSLAVHGRRKSRAGAGLEHHVEALLRLHGIRFERGVETENGNKPDFLFPGQTEYRNPGFDATKLAMLGAKSTLKERWRQVLSEAQRIETKHLLTLEPAISEKQTTEMIAKSLRLVVPRKLHDTYRPQQSQWLMSVADFLLFIRKIDRM